MQKTYTDLCPETGAIQTVAVTYAEVTAIGMMGHKAVRLQCDCNEVFDCPKNLITCPLAAAILAEDGA